MNFLLNPRKYDKQHPDQKTHEVMTKTMDFFETKGLNNLTYDDRLGRWYSDFLQFIKKEQIFATLLTPTGYGAPDSRFDLSRVCEFNEVIAFYSLAHQYSYQVSILGVGPIWMSKNEEIKHKAAQMLIDGGIFAFGLSEREHGADIYSNEMKLKPLGDGKYRADGSKYYIGNCNLASIVSTMGRNTETGDFVFFAVDSQHSNYRLAKQIYTTGSHSGYLGAYDLIEYPITEAEILSEGEAAWDASLSTVNIGKFQIGFSSLGMVEHSLYEALNHAQNRILYGRSVTEFPHIKKFFVEAYCRTVAMKLYALRSLDYFRSSSAEDRRYLLFNPIQKMKVTTQAVKVMDILTDIIAAKSYEQETHFAAAQTTIGYQPRLEGTTHVNMAQIVKFMQNYFFNPVDYPVIPKRDEPGDDSYLFQQTAGRVSTVTFPDYRLAYEGIHLPNIDKFREQIELLKEFLVKATPSKEQSKNIDYMLAFGDMFTLVVYGQLILENIKHYDISEPVVDYIFNFLVRDFAQFALYQISNFENSEAQMKYLQAMIMTPAIDPALVQTIWDNDVKVLIGAYTMNP